MKDPNQKQHKVKAKKQILLKVHMLFIKLEN